MIAIETHEAFASVVGRNTRLLLCWMSNHNFEAMTRGKHKRGVRGIPVYATVHDGAVYVWPINDGSAKVWWRHIPRQKPS